MKGVEPFEDHEIEAISQWCKKRRHGVRDRLLLMLLCHCALRVSEALSLTVGQVYQGGLIVDVLHLVAEQSKGGYGEGFIPLHKRVKWALIDYLQTRPAAQPHEPLILSQSGKALGRREAWRIINTAVKELGITKRLGTHSGRKYKATKEYSKTKDMTIAQGILRHRSLKTTVEYIGQSKEAVRRAFLED